MESVLRILSYPSIPDFQQDSEFSMHQNHLLWSYKHILKYNYTLLLLQKVKFGVGEG